MTRPWQITIAFTICVAVLIAAMTWVSMRVIRLEQDEARTQQQMAIEEDVRLALSRMDAAVNLIIAEENARPHYMYSAFHPLPRAFTQMFDPIDYQLVQAPSRLLFYDSPLTNLHFQINPDGTVSSPQVPQSNMRDVAEMLVPLAKRDGAHERINIAEQQLALLQSLLKREQMLTALPDALRQRDPLSEQLSLVTPMPQTAGQQGATNRQGRPPNNQSTNQDDGNTQSNLPPNQVDANPGSNNSADQTPNAPNSTNDDSNANHSNASQAAPPNGQGGQSQTIEPRNGFGNDPEVQQIIEQQEKEINANRRGGKPSSRLDNLSQFEWAKVKQIQYDYSERQRQQKLRYNELETVDVSEGVMQPMWVDDALILARRVQIDGVDYVQGVWFDWEALQAASLESIKDVFPDAKLLPVKQATNRPTARMLTTIPAMLDISSESAALAGTDGGIPSVLIVAWVCMLLAAAAVAVLLVGAVSLSERRGAFVSAVTHELRTPLTTFRMYTEMLAEKMVPDEAKQTQYLETMRCESDRLSHLVENVLAYARLERGKAPARVRDITVSELLDGVQDTLTQRADQADMDLRIEPNGVADTIVKADPTAVEQILFNLVDNACKYAGEAEDRSIHVEAVNGNGDGMIHLRIRDHGPGVSKQESRRLFKPFRKSARDAAHSAPGVGLGLALSLRLANAMAGNLRADTNNNGGACFELSLPKV